MVDRKHGAAQIHLLSPAGVTKEERVTLCVSDYVYNLHILFF